MNYQKKDELKSKFLDLIVNFEKEEQNFLVELFEKFIIIEEKDYEWELCKLCKKIELDENSKIYVTSINSYEYTRDKTSQKSNLNQVKLINFLKYFLKLNKFQNNTDNNKKLKQISSGNFLTYFFKTNNFKNNKIFSKSYSIYDGKTELPKNADFKLIIVDDYIGSGEQLKNYLEELHQAKVKKENIIIISIAIMNETYNALKDEYEIYYNYKQGKGISDYYHGEESEKAKLMIEKMSKKLNIKENIFGYRDSEALISLARIPNNTFAIFYKSLGKKNKGVFTR